MGRLEAKYSSYQETFDQLDILLVNAEDTSRDDVKKNFEKYDREIHNLLIAAYKTCDEKENEDLQTPTPTSNQIKLPSVDPVKFNGDLDKWSTFWSNFEALVHKNKALSPSIKFAYLQR